MKQSNIDYRNTYHFGNNPYKTESPSVSADQPEVSTKILPNKERQNVEIEKDEVVLKPDFTALHKAGGKRHSKGGTPVFLQPDSFVFSDDKTLAFGKEDFETFELKGAKKAKDNTPAKVLEKNVDIKHYNTLTAILDDPNKDTVAKKSAALMLEKYFNTIGNIAYVQEGKKGFPQDVPEFSMGTAPVYDTDLKDTIMENKQYMKYGGKVDNPYLPSMQAGGNKGQIRYVDSDGKYVVITKDRAGRMFKGNIDGKPATWDESSINLISSGLSFTRGDGKKRVKVINEKDGKVEVYNDGSAIKKYNNGRAVRIDNQGNEVSKGSYQGDNITWDAKPAAPATSSAPAPAPTPSEINQALTGKPRTGRITPASSGNPYTAPAAAAPAANSTDWGLWAGDKTGTFKDKYGVTNAADKITNLDEVATKLGYTGPKDNKAFQKWLYENNPKAKELIDSYHTKYGMPLGNDKFDGKIGIRWQEALAELTKTPPAEEAKPPVEKKEPPKAEAPKINPGEVDGPAQNGVPVNWKFTPWQKQSQLYNGIKWASVDREMPMRSQYKATYVNPYLVNPEQAVGDMKGIANMAMSSANNLNPILANAQKAAAYGQLLNQVPGIRSQYDNQNAAIINQSRQYNNQIKNDETLKNLAFDQQYWKESALGSQNFKNMRGFMADQFMNNRMRDVEANQKLAYNLLTLGPKPAYGFDWDTGHLYRNDKHIKDVESNMQGDNLQAYIQELKASGMAPKDIYANITKLMGAKHLGQNLGAQNLFGRSPFMQKKGGKITGNPYRK